jgi:AcrR family transcriptional regulator
LRWVVKKEKMESILTAARNMFGKYGMQKTHLDEVARHSKVAKATIYNYFGSKDQVYLEVLNREVAGMAAHIAEAVDLVASPLEKLRAFVFTSFRLLRESTGLLSLGPDVMDRLISGTETIRKNVFARQMAILQSILTEGVRQGTFRNDSVPTARSILYAVRGMEMTWLLDPGSAAMDDDIERLFDLLCTGILTSREVPCV